MLNKGTVLLYLYQCILVKFSCKDYSKVDFGHNKISDAIFAGQYLLLSTTVLNDRHSRIEKEAIKCSPLT